MSCNELDIILYLLIIYVNVFLWIVVLFWNQYPVSKHWKRYVIFIATILIDIVLIKSW